VSAPGAVVDSSVLLDVFAGDPRWAEWSERAMAEALAGGPLIVNAVVLAEIAPRFSRFEGLEATVASTLIVEEIPAAAAFVIGAHAAVTRRPLITRDPKRVAAHLPGAQLIAP
jgi:predicted nucleic acid-binding protein